MESVRRWIIFLLSHGPNPVYIEINCLLLWNNWINIPGRVNKEEKYIKIKFKILSPFFC